MALVIASEVVSKETYINLLKESVIQNAIAKAALSLKKPPSLAELRQLLGTLGEINEQHELFLRYASGVLGLWDQFPEKPEILPVEWKESKQKFSEREEKLGDCAYAPSSDYWSDFLAD